MKPRDCGGRLEVWLNATSVATLKLMNPDIHGGSEAATEAAKWINNLRSVLKEGRR
jgi:hypothetical protein